jgi:Bacterial Ig-like domain
MSFNCGPLMSKKVLSPFLILALIFLFISIYSGCAARGVPSGGPVDKTPPEIVRTYPVTDSTNIHQLSLINIEFSEMMNESSVANNIFISPPLDFEAEWESYTELNITLKDSLKNNQTYVVVLGAKISDIHNNKLASSYQLAFSSGSKIDQGKISGRIFGLARNQTLSIFAFDLNSDSLRFDKNKPDYVSQTGEKGDFTLSYLKNTKYRIFAVEDQNNNLKIDINQEKLAIPLKDVILDSSVNSYAGLNFRLTKIDTLAPLLLNVRSKSTTQIDMRLSEKIKIPFFNDISVSDSVSQNKIEILAFSQSVEEDNILEVFTSPMDSGNIYLFSAGNLTDSSGNFTTDTTISFAAGKYVQPDTFKILNFTPQDSAWTLHPDSRIYLDFNNPINKKSFEKNFVFLTKGKDTVSGYFSYPSAFEVEFIPTKVLTLDTVYTVKIDRGKLTNLWGDTLGDSVLSRHFKINKGDDYGEIAGAIFVKDSVNYPVYVQAARVDKKNEKYFSWAFDKKSYLIPFVPEGTYQMSAYVDMDSSKTYTAGNLFPFQFSEPFIVNGDTVKVRKRWESSGINLYLPGSH